MVPEASTGYLIERKKGAETTATILTPVPVPTYLTSYADIGLIAGTQYFYRIKAKNSAGGVRLVGMERRDNRSI